MTENLSTSTNTPEATELVYVPAPSWQPAVAALGAAGLVTGAFVWWPYAVIGAVLVLAAVAGMLRSAASEASRLPRRQRLTTAVVPPLPLRSRDG